MTQKSTGVAASGRADTHSHGPMNNEGRLAWAFCIIVFFMLVEVVGGLISGSLALLADAGHMISDAAALGMSWAAIHIGARPADTMRSYGYRRLEVLTAFVNGCALYVIASWIVYEAVGRLSEPVPVMGGTMLIVAGAGLAANVVAYLLLHGGDGENLNLRSASLHVVSDLMGSIGAIFAAMIILITGWTPIDPILSIVVALLILRSATSIIKSSAHILLEGAPPNVDVEALKRDLTDAVRDVEQIHHVHVWSLTNQQVMVTLHARPAPGADTTGIIRGINKRLREQFGVAHSTIQIDLAACEDESC